MGDPGPAATEIIPVLTTWWPIDHTGIGRCQWIARNRRCKAAPTQYLEVAGEVSPKRAQVICDTHAEQLQAGASPQRWAAPEKGFVLCGRGLVFFVRHASEAAG